MSNNTFIQDKIIQELSIRGGGVLQSIRQSDNTKLHEGDLVFIYPMIIDATLDRKWGDLLRDFVTVVFTNRIKQTNVLNIVSDATFPGTISSGGKELNPAQILRGHLGTGAITPQDNQSNIGGGDIDVQKRYEYSDVLEKLREYIGNQVAHDPQYSQLRPMISEVIAQNLIPIPVIIGTNKSKIHSSVLYWILFIAASLNLSLGKKGGADVNKIKYHIRQIDETNYEKYLRGVVEDKELESPMMLSRLISNIQDGVDKSIFNFVKVLDLDIMKQEMPVVSHSAELSTAIHNKAAAQKNLGGRSATSYRTFVANEIIGLLQSVTHAILPSTEIDISSKLIKFIDDVSDKTATDEAYSSMYGLILSNFQQGHTSNTSDDIDQLDVLIDRSKDMCIQNKEIDVTKVFGELANLNFSLTGKNRKEGFFAITGGAALANFTEDIIRIGSTLKGLSKTLNAFLSELGGTPINAFLSRRKDKIRGAVEDYFREGWEEGQGITTATQGAGAAWGGGPFRAGGTPGEASLFNSERFQRLTGNRGDQTAFEDNMYSTLTEILFFLFMFCFFSFYCEYLTELEAEVSVQRRDSTSFPNYILVLRIEYISRIFWGLSINNFRLDVADEADEEKLKDFNETEFRSFWKFFAKTTKAKAFEERLNSLMRGIDLTQAQRVVYNTKSSLENKIEYIYGSLSNEISRGDARIKEKFENKIKAEIEKTPVKKKPTRDTSTERFSVTSASDISKQIRLIQERLNIPNIIVIDEKNRKVYYKLMFMNRLINLDEGSLSSYISNQKNILTVF